jgi:hypothetical protein
VRPEIQGRRRLYIDETGFTGIDPIQGRTGIEDSDMLSCTSQAGGRKQPFHIGANHDGVQPIGCIRCNNHVLRPCGDFRPFGGTLDDRHEADDPKLPELE